VTDGQYREDVALDVDIKEQKSDKNPQGEQEDGAVKNQG